jgi:hypothetical protein
MYDLPALRQATDDWWAGLARALMAAGIDGVPQHLERQLGLDEVWRHPGLLISQTCGYPLTHALAGQLQVVATPAYGVEGCDGATYRSVFLVRDGDPAEELADLRGRRVAINSRTSQPVRLQLPAPCLGATGRKRAVVLGSRGERRSRSFSCGGARESRGPCERIARTWRRSTA